MVYETIMQVHQEQRMVSETIKISVIKNEVTLQLSGRRCLILNMH